MPVTPWADHTNALPPALSDEMDNARCDLAMALASEVLYNLTKRKYPGAQTDTIRPLARWRSYQGPPQWWQSYGQSRPSYGWCSCNRSNGQFGCATIPQIKLPGFPVGNVDDIVVKIDGEAFDQFDLQDSRYLVRVDGQGWPCCQDLTKTDDEPNTWSVQYPWGRNPPTGGVLACAALGSDLYLALSPDTADQSLAGARIRSITRNGITAAIADAESVFKDGFTGVAVADLWIMGELLGNERRPGKIIVPGRGRRARRIG
jgi:hypothetical protein